MRPLLQFNGFDRRIEADAGKDREFVISIKGNAVLLNASKTAQEECLDAKDDGYGLPIVNALIVPWAKGDGYGLPIANALIVPWAKGDGYGLPIANDLSFSVAVVARALTPRCFLLHELVENSGDGVRYQTKHQVD